MTKFLDHCITHLNIPEGYSCEIRGNYRVEIHLAAVIKLKPADAFAELVKLIKTGLKEYCYKNKNAGAYNGNIPIAYTLHVASWLYSRTDEKDIKGYKYVHNLICELIDQELFHVKNYSVRKSDINLADVYNTDLLFFSGAYSYLGQTEFGSQRYDLVVALFKKSMFRVMIDQSIYGDYYYHSTSFSRPLNYSLLVGSILVNFGANFGNNFSHLISRSKKKLTKYLNKYVLSKEDINWLRFKADDKAGCCWADGWLLSFLSEEDAKRKETNLLSEFNKNGALYDRLTFSKDIFFTSWFLLSLIVVENSRISNMSSGSREKPSLLVFALFIFHIKIFVRRSHRFLIYGSLILKKMYRSILDFGPDECHKKK